MHIYEESNITGGQSEAEHIIWQHTSDWSVIPNLKKPNNGFMLLMNSD